MNKKNDKDKNSEKSVNFDNSSIISIPTFTGSFSIPSSFLDKLSSSFVVNGFSLKEVSTVTSLPSTTVKLYTNQGLISPGVEDSKGRGTVKRYSIDNVFELKLIKRLQEFGLELKQIHLILEREDKNFLALREHIEKYRTKKLRAWILVYILKDEIECSIFETKINEDSITVPIKKHDNALLVEITEIFE